MNTIEPWNLGSEVFTHFSDACDVVMAEDGTPINSNKRHEWLEARRQLMTASDVAAIIGLDPQRDATSVFLSKRYPAKKNETLTWHDPRFWGLQLEQSIGRIVAEYCNWEFFPSGYLLRSKDHPRIGATLDAEVKPANENWRPYEGKNVSSWMARDWHLEDQTPPPRVLIQTQTQMMVTGAELVEAFALLGGNQPCSIQVAPSQELRDIIVEKAEELFHRLETDQPYPATHKSTEAIKEAFPGDDGSIIQLDAEAARLVELSSRQTRQLADMQEDADAVRNQIKMIMGPALYGRLPEQVMVERKRLGELYEMPVEYVKWGTTYTPPAWRDERQGRTLHFVKDLPKQLQSRRRRR